MAGLVRTGLGRNDRARRRVKQVDAPEVPTFQTEVVSEWPQSIATAEDPVEEAVRRMVEAAYT